MFAVLNWSIGVSRSIASAVLSWSIGVNRSIVSAVSVSPLVCIVLYYLLF